MGAMPTGPPTLIGVYEDINPPRASDMDKDVWEAIGQKYWDGGTAHPAPALDTLMGRIWKAGAMPTLAWACCGGETCLLSRCARLASMAPLRDETPSE